MNDPHEFPIGIEYWGPHKIGWQSKRKQLNVGANWSPYPLAFRQRIAQAASNIVTHPLLLNSMPIRRNLALFVVSKNPYMPLCSRYLLGQHKELPPLKIPYFKKSKTSI